jgi:hypothetical protein
MGRYQLITRTSLRGPKGTTFTDEEREQLSVVGLLPDAVEGNDQQLERELGHLEEKPTELERYVYLIRLCDRNERLFYQVLMSDRIRFLLASDSRRKLFEIWLQLPSFARPTQFDPSQRISRADAA